MSRKSDCNDRFTWFGTTGSKSRLNFLELLRAGHGDYVVNAEALAYMRSRSLAGPVIGLSPATAACERIFQLVDGALIANCAAKARL